MFVKYLWVVAAAVALGMGGTAANAQSYDIDTLGVPKFVNTPYIDLRKVTAISKFRSNNGHDYSDSRQFGAQGYRAPVTGRIEACSSMKHYFMSPDDTVNIYAPTAGEITVAFDEPIGGAQISIRSDLQPAFSFTIFHVVLDPPLRVGDRVAEGQLLGHHAGLQTWSDIAVWVRTPRGNHLISYFETMTDTAFAAFKARGIETLDQLILTKSYREANPVFSCLGRQTIMEDPVPLTGGAAAQTITVTGLRDFATTTLGDTPIPFTATATSNLPVTVTSRQPKVCAVTGSNIVARRPGRCIIRFSQSGNADIFAAPDRYYSMTVLPTNTVQTPSLRLGGIFPPSAAGPQSYIRFLNRGNSAGTVTLSLLNGDTGKPIATWTSPSLAPFSARQFAIADLEGATAPGFIRPSVYGLKIEPATTIFGTLQHVLFDSAVGGLTNASSCNVNVDGTPDNIPFVYSSALPDYPSTLIFVSPTTNARSLSLQLRLSDSGAPAGSQYTPPVANNLPAAANTAIAIPVTSLESRIGFVPVSTQTSYTAASVPGFGFLEGHFHYIVNNRRPNVIADMTTVCALSGVSQTVASPLQTSGIHSGDNITAQSYFRFYNDGATAGPVTVVLRDPENGSVLGRWASPTIPPGAYRQFAVGAMEKEIGLAKKDIYVATIETELDGYFQHALWRAPDGALSNFSTCAGSVTTLSTTLIGVHSSRIGATGYPSSIVVNNTGATTGPATIDLIDPRDGARLSTYITPAIPADGQYKRDIAAIERDAGFVPDAETTHYVLRMRGDFVGFLQHQIQNQAAGVVTDMTAVCAM